MKESSILVTGGAGYIGSHVVKQLGEFNESIIVLDNLSTGFSHAVLHGKLIVGDAGDEVLVTNVLRDFRVDTVMHFAAHTVVEESVRDPLKYYQNNVVATCKLLQCCIKAGVKHFIFSSSAAVYGIPDIVHVTEETATSPINPYGSSKLMCEKMLDDIAAVNALNYVSLRYFNVAGADPGARIGQATKNATNLIKIVAEVMAGKRELIEIFGNDYDTPDGTCIRDYIHVSDIASAHVSALTYLRQGGESVTLNCGYGRGYSVKEVLAAAQQIVDKTLVVREQARRLGDPPAVIANADRLKKLFNWLPRFANLELILKTALAWERK